jgi:UDP-N-acetylmuramoyl-L-alanyl-D-glutamate--2,6-diaminopimelate ligase
MTRAVPRPARIRALTDTGFSIDQLFPGAFPDKGERRVGGVAFDSRKVAPGEAFVALAGAKADGARFISDAVQRGAVAIVSSGARPADLPAGIAYAQVDDPRLALSLAAAKVHPRQPGTVVAVTGTSGKSSVAEFSRQIFKALGRKAASVGTIGVVTEAGADYGSLTTPDPLSLHASLDRLAGDGVTHLSMEASSHGLDQHRLDGVRLSAGAFLNLGRDHLDYHPSVEDYLAAKLRLWELLPAGAPVVINRDEPYADKAETAATAGGHKVIGIGRGGDRLKLIDVAREGFSQRLTVEVDGAQDRRAAAAGQATSMAGNALVAAGPRDRRRARTCRASSARAIAGLAGCAGAAGAGRRGEWRARRGRLLRTSPTRWRPCAQDSLRPYASGRLDLRVRLRRRPRQAASVPLMGAIAADEAPTSPS